MTRQETEKIVAEARAKGETPDLSWSDLRKADLSGADLRGTDLYGANLHGANLCGANLHEADLRKANLHEARLTTEQAALLPVLLGIIVV